MHLAAKNGDSAEIVRLLFEKADKGRRFTSDVHTGEKGEVEGLDRS